MTVVCLALYVFCANVNVLKQNNGANTRGHAYKLFKSQYTNSARTNFFANRIVNAWDSLPATVDVNSLAAFKRTVRGADLFAFLLYNCTLRVLL